MKTRKRDRQAGAKELLEQRSKRTSEGQVKHLDKLLGVGIGAKKERARLALLISKEK